MRKITIYALDSAGIREYNGVKGETIIIHSAKHLKFNDEKGKEVRIIGNFLAIIQQV